MLLNIVLILLCGLIGMILLIVINSVFEAMHEGSNEPSLKTEYEFLEEMEEISKKIRDEH